MIREILLALVDGTSVERPRMFKIVGYDGIKRTFVRTLTSKEPVHILLVGPPGQAKTLFLKCIQKTFGERKALSYRGWVDVKWGTMEDASRRTLTSASEQVVHALNNTVTQFASHPSAVSTSGLPVAAVFGFVPGLITGLKKG